MGGDTHIVPKILQSLPVSHSLPPHPDEGLELREEVPDTPQYCHPT